MQRRNFRSNRPAVVPNPDGSVNISLKGEVAGETDVVFTGEAFEAFKMNAKGVNRTVLASKFKVGQQLTVEDVKASMNDGAHFIAKLANDGQTESCARCSRTEQPALVPYTDRDSGEQKFGGNFRVAKAEEVQKFDSNLLAKAKELTGRIMAAVCQTVPGLAVILFICGRCRREQKQAGIFNRYYSREGVVSELLNADGRIGAAQARRAFDEGFDARRRRPSNGNDRGQTNRTGQRVGGGMRGGNRGSQPDKVDWNGIYLYERQATALIAAVAAGKVENSLDGLMKLSAPQLVELGVVRDETEGGRVLGFTAQKIERNEERKAQTAAAGQNGFNLGEAAGAEELSKLSLSGSVKGRSKSRRTAKSDNGEPRARRGRPTPRSSQTSLADQD